MMESQRTESIRKNVSHGLISIQCHAMNLDVVVLVSVCVINDQVLRLAPALVRPGTLDPIHTRT